MNQIHIGRTKITLPKNGCLFLADEVPNISRARIFDPTKHSFNPLQHLDYLKATHIVEIFDALFPRGDSTLTKDTGLDFIAAALGKNPPNLAQLFDELDMNHTGQAWAWGKLQRLMRSPVLNDMLTRPTNFSFNPRSTILAKVNRAELGDFDALAIGLFLMAHFQGQFVIPDLGFYGRDVHSSLIREQRLIAGVRFLDELPPLLRRSILVVEDKVVAGALYDDAVLLAKHAGLRPDALRNDNAFNEFIDNAMSV